MPRTCAACGSQNPDRAKFCIECGAKLIKALTAVRERRSVVVLFADLSGYTAFSSGLDPEEVSEVIDNCYRIMGECVYRYEGTVDKYMGDCVMAVFGAPKAHENDTERALRCALDIKRELTKYSLANNLNLDISIGINPGLVLFGRMGDERRKDHTVLGDAVNIASRLEGKAKKGQILVSEKVFKSVRGKFRFKKLAPVRVKGKRQKLKVHEVIDIAATGAYESTLGAGLATLVGRDAEIKKIARILTSVRQIPKPRRSSAGLVSEKPTGSGRILAISGEAGVGKSRMVFETRQLAEKRGYTFLRGGCDSFGANRPFRPFANLMRSYLNVAEGEDEITAKDKIENGMAEVFSKEEQLEDRIGAFGFLLGYEYEDSLMSKLEGKAKIDHLTDSLDKFFFKLAEKTPLIVAIEDLHWVDPSTVDYLDRLRRQIADKPILLLLVYRPQFEHKWRKVKRYAEIHLEPLSLNDVTEFIKSILIAESLPKGLAKLILAKTSGNPFFIEEIIKSLLQRGILHIIGNKPELTVSLNDIEIPDTVQGVIMARVDALEANTRRALQEASVIGETFLLKILEEVSTVREKLDTHLADLEQFELIFEKSRIPEIEYMFKHVLTRDVLYNSITRKRRKELHKAIAQCIERIWKDNLTRFYADLAHHYELEGKTDKEVDYLVKEAKRLLEVSSFLEARALFEKANSKIQKVDTRYIYNAIGIASIERRIGRPQEAIRILDTLEKRSLEPVLAAKAALVRGLVLWGTGAYDEAIRKYAFALKVFEETNSHRELARTLNLIGVVHWNLNELGKAGEFFEKSIEVYKSIGEESGLSFVLENLGGLRGSLEYLHEALNLANKTGNRVAVAGILNDIGVVYARRGEHSTALDHYRRSLRIHEEVGNRRGVAIALFNIGSKQCDQGQYSAGYNSFRRSLATFEEVDDRRNAAGVFSNMGALCSACGDYDTALRHFGESAKRWKRLGLKRKIAGNYVEQAAVLLEKNDMPGSLKVLKKAQRILSSESWKRRLAEVFLLKARALSIERNYEAAIQEAEKGWRLAEESENPELILVAQITLGATYTMTGETEKADRAFKESRRIASKMHPNAGAEVYYEYGKFLFEQWKQHSRKRDKDKAKKILIRAKELYDYRVKHGYRRKELDEINSMLTEIEKKRR